MNCRKFDRDLPDWIAGRLPAEQFDRMADHHAGCPQCQRAAAAERVLRQRLEDLPLPVITPEIGTRLAQRLALDQPARFGFGLRRPNLAFGGALAALGLCCALLWSYPSYLSHLPRQPSGLTQLDAPQKPLDGDETANVDETLIVQKISESQQLPDAESEDFLANAEHRRQIQRTVLLRDRETP